MHAFAYLKPQSLDEAISLLESHRDAARYVAGGTDVLVKIKERKLAPEYLISLRGLRDLRFIEQESHTGELLIGALSTHRDLERSVLIRENFPIITDAVENIGSVQVRNVATIGGNLCNGAPSADGAIPLLALGANLKLVGPKGDRTLKLKDFFLGPGQTDLEEGEILREIQVPFPGRLFGGAYFKLSRRAAMELPILGVAVALTIEEDRITCRLARVALGVAAPTPIRASQAEAFLAGKPLSEATLTEAGRIAGEEARVRDSIRGEAWYRREMVGIMVRRMGLLALERIKS